MVLELRGLGIPIRLRPGFLLIVCLLALGAREEVGQSPLRLAVFGLAVAIAVWFHELGHALPASRYGWEPVIELSLSLGVTVYHRRAFVGRAGRLLLVAGGPLFGFLLAAFAYAALLSSDPRPDGLGHLFLGTLSTASAVWAAFSLVPVLPLDGGHLVAELASMAAPRQGYRIAALVSLVLCMAGLAYGLAHREWVLAALTALLAYRQKATLDSMKRVRDAEANVSPRDAAYLALARNDAEAVVRHATRAVEVADGTGARDEATYLLAWGHFLAGRPHDARAVLVGVSPARPRDFALEGAIAHDLGEYQRALELFEHALPRATRFAEPRMVHAIVETGRFREAVELFADELGEKFSERGIATVQRAAYDAGAVDASLGIGELLFRRTQDGAVAFLNACANARLDRLTQARRWLERAREHGFRRLDALDDEPALEALRKAPDWDELRRGFDSERSRGRRGSIRAMSILPPTWDLPESLRRRVGASAGRQRIIAEEGHVLVLLHEVPTADATAERVARMYWRSPAGSYRSTGGDDRTIKPLRQHVERYVAAIDAIEERLDRAVTASDWFGILTDIAPMVRSSRNMARVLQELRELVGADREVIAVRDRAADAERAADLVHQWASQGLDYCTARSNEEQARLATYLGRASQRLNLVAAFTFPITALGSFFGVNLANGLETTAAPHLFWTVGAVAFAIGVGLAARMPRIPDDLAAASPRGARHDGKPGG